MSSPYKTNCFNYNKIGCTSRQNCIEKCYAELALIQCKNSLPLFSFMDKNNDKDILTSKSLLCSLFIQSKFCEDKYKLHDCFNEYYSFKVISDQELMKNERINKHLKNFNESTFNSNNPNAKFDAKLMSIVKIIFNNEPDTIYTHSPLQNPIEFICFIGGVISLWTGFSVISVYAYGKRFFRRNQNKVDELDKNSVIVNHYHIHNNVCIPKIKD